MHRCVIKVDMDKNAHTDEDKIVSYFHDRTDTTPEISSQLKNSKDFKDTQRIAGLRNYVTALFRLSSEDQVWRRIDRRIRPRSIFQTWTKYAAIIVLSMLVATIAMYLLQSGQSNQQLAYSTLTVPKGQMAQLELPDGTQVWLNSETVLTYPAAFSKKSRDIELRGEAYLNVKTDVDKPFNIKTEKSIVRVTGTSLNIRAYEGESEITTLVEGRVALFSQKNELLLNLSPGQSAVFDQSSELDVYPVDTKQFTMWREGKLHVDQVSLIDLCNMLERWYSVRIVIEDEELKSRKISGTVLKYKPVDQILDILTIRENIDFDIELVPNASNKITLRKKLRQ